MCTGLPQEVRTAAVKYVKNKIIEDLKAEVDANTEPISQNGLNEVKRIKYNFHENELKDNMNDLTLIDVAFKKTE
jgi:methyl coenzyme M reductase gamma subunit